MKRILEMVDKNFVPILLLIFLATLLAGVPQTFGVSDSAYNGKDRPYSGIYAPYRSYEIRSQIAGTVTEINFREGDILPARKRLLRLDSSLEESQLENFRALEKLLEREKRLLEDIIRIKKKNYLRYEKLFQKGQVSEQALENKRLELISAQDSQVKIEKEQRQIENSVASLEDHIRKASFAFDKDLYVSQLFVERFESVSPGSPIARLLDITRARIRLIVAPDLFKVLSSKLKSAKRIAVSIMAPDGRWFNTRAEVEHVKLDPAKDYLYSYSFDLVVEPVKALLWGEVVKVNLGPLMSKALHGE